MSDAAGTPPPPQENKPDQIDIKVKDQSEAEVFFKIKKTTKLSKVFGAYCDRQGLRRDTVRFLFEGNRVQDTDTPAGLDMEDGDMIDAFLEQVGGREAEAPDSYVTFAVRNSKRVDVFFKSKQNQGFSKAFSKYSGVIKVPLERLEFFLGDIRVEEDHTPGALGLSEGGLIMAVETQVSLHRLSVEQQQDELAKLKIDFNHLYDMYEALCSQLSQLKVEMPGPNPTAFKEADLIMAVGTSLLAGQPDKTPNLRNDYNNLTTLYEATNTQLHQLTKEMPRLSLTPDIHNDSSACEDSAAHEDSTAYDDPAVYDNTTTCNDSPTYDAPSAPSTPINRSICDRITVKVSESSSGRATYYLLRNTQRLVKLRNHHNKLIGRSDTRFLFDGQRIHIHDTPESIDMEDGDTIEVVFEQCGGIGGSNGEADEVVKPEVLADNAIQIKVQNDRGDETVFRLKQTATLGKLMKAYAKQHGRTPDSLRFFLADGERVKDTDTPAALNMENGNIISVHQKQQGGSYTP